MEENKDVKLEEKKETVVSKQSAEKKILNKIWIWFGVAIGILDCIVYFILGQSLANKEDEKIKEKEEVENEVNKDETVVEPENDEIEPYSYSPNCQNSKDTYIVDVDIDKYNNIIDYIEDQENIKVTLSYCTENLNDETGMEPFIGHTYTLTEAEQKAVFNDIRNSSYTLYEQGLGGACPSTLKIYYEHNNKEYSIDFFDLIAISEANDGNIYAILDKNTKKPSYDCMYYYENLSPTAKALLSTLKAGH